MRIRESARLGLFSPGVSSLPRGFFGAAGFGGRWVLALKISILVKHRLVWISNLLLVSHFLVMRVAGVRGTEIPHALRACVHNADRLFDTPR